MLLRNLISSYVKLNIRRADIRFIFPVIVFFFTTKICAQVQAPQILPISPNASELVKYADYPVSYYTGIPNINIPIYEINIDGYKLPISLNYHSSGIKASQEATWTGLGWMLNATGVISRTIRGYDDFIEYSHPAIDVKEGYYKDADIEDPTLPYYYSFYPMGPDWIASKLSVDAEPDVFYYSLPGGGGKFLIDKSRGVVLFDKSSNVKIDIENDLSISSTWNKNLCFRITTADGTQYYYKRRETTKIYGESGSLNENSTNPNSQFDDDIGAYLQSPLIYTSSWYLDKITTVNKRTIDFIYEMESCKSPTQESCKKYDLLAISGQSMECGPNHIYPVYSRSKSIQETLRLSQIVWSEGHIDFICSDRVDMVGVTNSLSPKKLDEIKVYDSNNESIKKIKFIYTYFNSAQTGQFQHVFKRLKLEKIIANNDETQSHTFKYFEGTMIAKNSNNTDYWGLSNGKVYGANYYVSIYSEGVIYDGADKPSDFDFAKIGTLNEIIYPTTGSCKFEYDLNDFSGSSFRTYIPSLTTVPDIQVYNQSTTIGEYEGVPSSASYTFTVSESARISITKYLENVVCPNVDATFPYNDISFPIGRLKRVSPSPSTIMTFKVPLVNGNDDYCEYVEADQGFFPTVLSPGTYVFEALTPPKDVFVKWKLKISQITATPAIYKGGGLRIAKIIMANKTRSFTYTTGTLLIQPVLAHAMSTKCFGEFGGNLEIRSLVQSSSSSIPLSTFRNGNSVGYDWVEESVTGAGKTRYSFFNEPEEESHQNDYGSFVTPNLPSGINYSNGLVNRIDQYKNSTIVQTTEFSYATQVPSNSIKAFVYSEGPDLIFRYGYNIVWYFKNGETTTKYFNQTGINNSISTIKSFVHNPFAQLVSEKSFVDNAWEENQIFYPTDFTDDISTGMVGKFLIGIPLEQISLKHDKVIFGKKTVYDYMSGMYLPKAIYSISTTVPLPKSSYSSFYKLELTYDAYNQWGKVLQISNVGYPKVSYVWGYKSQYPIAEIVNASYSDVLTAIGGQSVIDQLNSSLPSDEFIMQKMNILRSSLPTANVTSFTYKPLIGMTSKTDVGGRTEYYEYDSSQRLKIVKDFQKNILKTYDYHYHTP